MQNNESLQLDQLNHLRSIFDRFDTGDSNITFDVLPKAMQLLGINPTQEEINIIINQYDLDGDGHIDFAQFQQIYMAPQPNEKEVMEAFREFDRNGTGLLDVTKIQAIAEQFKMDFTNEQVRRIIEELDQDHDGYINWNQFRNALLE